MFSLKLKLKFKYYLYELCASKVKLNNDLIIFIF